MTVRRGAGWAAVAFVVALVAFAPFRDGDRGGDEVTGGGPLGAPAASADDASSMPTSALPAGGSSGGSGRSTGAAGSGSGSPSGAATPTTTSGSGASSPTPTTAAPTAPDLPEPTAAELAVLGPLVAAMDAGQTAGTPLVLGIATAVVASGLPGDDSVPPEARPVVQALAQLIATPGTQVNEVTAQNSLALAQLDRALGELAFANPALNEAIHQTADVLATMGRSAAPVSPPGGVLLEDLSVLLGFFVVV